MMINELVEAGTPFDGLTVAETAALAGADIDSIDPELHELRFKLASDEDDDPDLADETGEFDEVDVADAD